MHLHSKFQRATKLAPRNVKKAAKLVLNLEQDISVSFGRATGRIDFPVPPNSSMRKTSSKSVGHFYSSGITTYLPITTSALREQINLKDNINILDFGCGVGRQLLHFTRHWPAPSYHACDIDHTSVAFIAKNYSWVNTYCNSFTPPLEYPTSFFDMIYSVSIFSHLKLDDQKIWLTELGRVTKPGGYCFLTTEGYTALKSLQGEFGAEENKLRAALNHSGYLYKEYEGWGDHAKYQNIIPVASNMMGVERSCGNTVVSAAYVRRNWGGDDLEVIDILEGVIDHRQDLVILRRR